MDNLDYTQCYCYECLYYGTSPFGHSLCRKDGWRVINHMQRACKDIRSVYETNDNEENK